MATYRGMIMVVIFEKIVPIVAIAIMITVKKRMIV